MALTWCIFVLCLFALAIWIYQSIVLPSIRQRLRFELFSLRDQMRELVIAGRLKEDGAAFRRLHHRINVMISAVPFFDYALVSTFEAGNPELKARAKRFQELINESIPEVQEIFNKALMVMTWALIFNSLFWFTLMLAAAVPLAIPQGIWKLCGLAVDRVRSLALPAFELGYKDLEASSLTTLKAAS